MGIKMEKIGVPLSDVLVGHVQAWLPGSLFHGNK